MNISDLRQEISILREERLKAENRLMQAKDMFASSLILRKVICGNPNCKCQEAKIVSTQGSQNFSGWIY